MSIHQRIRDRRIELGFSSHKALADAIGVSWQTVQLWEKEGGTAPTRTRMPAVASALKTTPDWLLYGPAADRNDGGLEEPAQPAPAPPWCDPEAFRLLELYYQCDPGRRKKIMGFAGDMAEAFKSSDKRDQLEI